MEGQRLLLKAPAKINLFLRITGQRADGYHTLESRMQQLALHDELELEPCAEGIHLRCAGAALPTDTGNIVFRAAALFLQNLGQEDRPRGVRIALKKQIPLAAGLGGGSSDAAACLRGLNTLYRCGCSAGELAAMGLRLGADVPFFLLESPAALATGIGEILQPVETLSDCHILLVNPGFPVSSTWAYQNFALTAEKNDGNLHPLQNELYETTLRQGFLNAAAWAAALINDLESVTAARYSEIGQIKATLRQGGAFAALMSGSGPTVFGLFADRLQAEACRAVFAGRYAHVFLTAPLAGAA